MWRSGEAAWNLSCWVITPTPSTGLLTTFSRVGGSRATEPREECRGGHSAPTSGQPCMPPVSTLQATRHHLNPPLAWGATHRRGSHLARHGSHSPTMDASVHPWFMEESKFHGSVIVDQRGNTFPILPGERSEAPPTMTGSRRNTQPSGGRYDGILGGTAGVEAFRTLVQGGLRVSRRGHKLAQVSMGLPQI